MPEHVLHFGCTKNERVHKKRIAILRTKSTFKKSMFLAKSGMWSTQIDLNLCSCRSRLELWPGNSPTDPKSPKNQRREKVIQKYFRAPVKLTQTLLKKYQQWFAICKIESRVQIAIAPNFAIWRTHRVLKDIYHHHPESKKGKSSEGSSGSIHPYGRYGNAEKKSKSISTIAILWPVKAIFGKRAATVEVDTSISPDSGS